MESIVALSALEIAGMSPCPCVCGDLGEHQEALEQQRGLMIYDG